MRFTRTFLTLLFGVSFGYVEAAVGVRFLPPGTPRSGSSASPINQALCRGFPPLLTTKQINKAGPAYASLEIEAGREAATLVMLAHGDRVGHRCRFLSGPGSPGS